MTLPVNFDSVGVDAILADPEVSIVVNLTIFEAHFEVTRRALEAGCDGVVSSGLEAPMLREFIDHRLLVVTPGIRPVENKPVDDQKRTVDVAQAFANGADYIVVGRPIRDAADPRAAAEAIQQTIAQSFAGARA